MHLARLELVRIGPFEHVVVPFADEEGQPRAMTIVYGSGGVGKTTLLAALAGTRPGHAILPISAGEREVVRSPDTDVVALEARASAPPTAYAITEWILGQDDPDRPHVLAVATPSARVFDEDQAEAFRRREQSVFDRLARERGFAFLAISSTRWFSRQPVSFHAPARTIAHYDVRTPTALDDATRSDLSRETKQALAYAAIASALALRSEGAGRGFETLGQAMKDTVNVLSSLAGYTYLGLDPGSFEPIFLGPGSKLRPFDALPTRVRHLVAFAALSVRVLWAAYPGQDPRQSEGVISIDEVDLHQDALVQARLPSALREALPHVQWVLTATSPVMAGSSDTRDVMALRRLPEADRVELFLGSEAQTH